MDAAELKRLAAENGLPAIPVTLTDDDDNRPRFDGPLEEFWAAAKSVGAKAVFLLVHQMDETDFERNVSSDDIPHVEEDDEDESFDGENYTVDLESVSPSISKFRKYIGKDCAFIVIAKGGIADLDIFVTENWWDEFQNEATEAVESWVKRRNEEHGVAEAEHEKKNAELLQQLRGLINDREFCLLRTHRAKIAYAIEKFPDLAELDEFTIKPEIQKLADRIEAKGLNKQVRR